MATKRSALPRGSDDSAAEPEVLINPMNQWARAVGDVSPVLFVEGVPPEPLPYVGDVITSPRFLDPQTRQPAPMVVLQIERKWDPARRGHNLVVVVARRTPH
jgi:hypothetical protein